MISHPNRKANPIIALVRATVGRRATITRQEMHDLLADLAANNLVDLDNGWQRRRVDGDHAQAWTDMCGGFTIISVLADTDPVHARLASSNPGSIRYDEPGSMHPMLRATVMFAPASVCERRATLDYLRARAKRVFIVEDEAAGP